MIITRRSFAMMAVAGAAALYFPGSSKAAALKTEMKMKTNKVKRGLVVWYSQTGNTKRIGKLIAATWAKAGIKTDSGDYRKLGKINPADYDVIAVGSPVHYYEVPENFRQWINGISKIDGTPVASFVTFGGEGGNQHNTAYSILEMLSRKGGVPVGMGLFGAMSSFAPTWSAGSGDRVLKYKDQPDNAVYSRVRKYAADILANVQNGKSFEASEEFSFSDYVRGGVSIGLTKLMITNHHVNKDKCIACGTCVENCPVKAISPDQAVVDTDKCIACLGCVNNCPAEAVEMKFMGRNVYGFNEFLKRNKITVTEPEELKG
jgi:ferredoxin/flavodoxin